MATTFAKLKADGVVENVIVADQEFIDTLPDAASYVETFIDANGDAAKGYNYAIIGGKFDADKKAFIAPQPFASWVLDAKFAWASPVPMPEAKQGFVNFWNENSLGWEEFEIPTKEYPTDGKSYRWDVTSRDWVERI
jgi:hypothetical protein